MNLITDSWRLKLLAVGLSVLMLGAVAFAQNPPTFKTLTITNSFVYSIPSNLVVINPPTRATVRVTGLADIIQSMTASSLTGSFDLSKVSPGPAVKVNLIVKSLVGNVTVQNPLVPFALDIDQLKTVPLTVQVRTPRVTAGWVVTKTEASCPGSPCVVNFDGPQSWETDSHGQPNLKAYADFLAPVNGNILQTPNIAVTLEQNGTPLAVSSFSKTVPVSSLDIPTVFVRIDAKTGTTSKQIVLIDAPPSHGPPTGYRVTGINIDPISVVVTGRADALVSLQSLALPSVDLTGHTTNFTFRVTIPYPAGVNGSVPTARITYLISANPNVQPSPTPT